MKMKMHRIIDAVTLYRLAAAPLLVILLLSHHTAIFKFGLLISFATDAVDGSLARHYHTVSAWGAKMDSIADDLTVGAGITGIIFTAPDFLKREWLIVVILTGLYIIKSTAAWIRYRKMTAFHTWLAKFAAILQAFFLVAFFFSPPFYTLFYITAAFTAIDLVEETLMVLLLKDYYTDVRSIFQALRLAQKAWPQKLKG